MTDNDQTQPYEPPRTGVPEGAAVDGPHADFGADDRAPATARVDVGHGRPGRSRARWLVAGVATLLVAGTVAGATLLLTGQSGDPDVLAWTPADRVSYVELRLDLPGSQQAEVAKILSAFPGFADQAAFPQKIGEALDRLVAEASDGAYDYQQDIDPWFGGQLSFSTGPGMMTSTPDPSKANGLVLLSIEDAARAKAWVDEVVAKTGVQTTTETYAGTTLTIVPPEQVKGMPEGKSLPSGAYAFVGPTLAIGDVASVKAALDTKGANGLATNQQFEKAEASVSDDRIAFMYADSAETWKALDALPEGTDPGGTVRAVLDLTREVSPAWSAAAIRAVDGALLVESRSPHVAALGPADPHASTLANLVPSDTLFLATGHDVGKTIAKVRELAATKPELKTYVDQLDSALNLVGGFDAAAKWIGDVGVAVEPDGDGVVGGVVITPTDAAAARQLVSTLSAFVQLGAGQMGLETRKETYGGADITIVDLSSLEQLAGGATEGDVPMPEKPELAFTVTDEAVVIGLGSSFVHDVLDARDGPSLADDQRFAGLVGRVGSDHSQLFWTDVAAIRGLVESRLGSDLPADYGTEVKPYLAPFDAVVGTMVQGDELDSGSILVTFNK